MLIIILKNNIKKIIKIFFLVYILFLIYVLFLNSARLLTYNNYNLKPFNTIIRYFKYYNKFNFINWFLNIFGNILLFIPFGILVPSTFNKINTHWKILAFTAFVSFSVEILQYTTKVGEFDIDDILLNTLGSLLGFLILIFCRKKITYLKR